MAGQGTFLGDGYDLFRTELSALKLCFPLPARLDALLHVFLPLLSTRAGVQLAALFLSALGASDLLSRIVFHPIIPILLSSQTPSLHLRAVFSFNLRVQRICEWKFMARRPSLGIQW